MLIDLCNCFYESCLYNGFLCKLFPLKLLLVWKAYFEICKYAFLIFEKGDKQKTVPGILKFVSILFNIWKKGRSKKLCQVF